MDQEKISAFNEQRALQTEERAKTEDTAFALKSILDSQKDIEDSVKESILRLVQFLAKNKPEVSVINQQPFPKYDEVVKSVNQVVAEIKNSNKALKTVEQKEVDFSGVIKSLDGLSKLVSKLPTTIPVPKSVEVSNQKDYSGKFDEVTTAVGKIPAPVVNVEKPIIPDNSKELDKILKAVEKIKFPDLPKTDLEPLLKATKKISDTISGLRFPVANYVLPFKDANGAATQAQLDSSGNVPISGSLSISESVYTTRIDEASGTVTYIGTANPGTATSAASWQIKKIDSTNPTSILFADGDSSFNNVWNDRASLSYS